MKIKLWDKKAPLTLPNGAVYEKEQMFTEYPFSKVLPTVLEYMDEAMTVVGAIDSLPMLRGIYQIDGGLTDEEAVTEIERLRNAPPPEPAPEAMPASKEDVGFLLQQITELDLTMREAGLL